MAEEKKVKYDIDGYDAVTSALMELLNQYPALSEHDKIAFSSLGEDVGKAMYPISGAVVETEKTTITGKVTKVCLYPFYIIYRASGLSEKNKEKVKEWLDTLGKWLEKQDVVINGESHKLTDYPPLTGGRFFLSIERQSPSYLDVINDNKSEDWAAYITAKYQHEYQK